MSLLGNIGRVIGRKARSQSFIIKFICIFSTVLSICACTVTVLTFISVARWSELYVNRSNISDKINRFSLEAYEASMQLRSYCSTASEEAQSTYLSVMDTLKINEVTAVVNSVEDTEQLERALKRYTTAADSVLSRCQNAYDLILAGYADSAQAVLFSDRFTETLLEMSETGDALLQAVDDQLTPILEMEQHMLEMFVNITALSLVVVSAIQILLVVYTNKAILKPVRLIKDELVNFSQGNYSSEFTIKEDDSDIGQLSAAINASKQLLHKMTEELTWLLDQIAQGNVSFYIDLEYIGEFQAIKAAMNTILDENNNEFSRIRGSADSISTAADEMSQSSIKVAQGGQEQSESISSLSASISDITQKITDNAANAQTASDYSKKTAASLENGRREMGALMEAMREIEATSNEINKIIRTIEDIAFETNILSLNAAVEAANAGDAGKGFGVVADQVHSLSLTVSGAVNNITELIGKSGAAVNKGVQHATETAKSVKAMVEDSQYSNDAVIQIAQAAIEEKEAVQEISTQLSRIEEVIQSNNNVAQQSAAAAEELAGQANMLRQIMERYQLREQ